jgi:hypothetical protein
MLKTAATKLKNLFRSIKEAGIQRHRRKLAQLAESEARERKAIVVGLMKKFAAARADCEQKDKASTKMELSVKEILFIESDLNTWNRYFKEREIYRPLMNKQPPLRRSSPHLSSLVG